MPHSREQNAQLNWNCRTGMLFLTVPIQRKAVNCCKTMAYAHNNWIHHLQMFQPSHSTTWVFKAQLHHTWLLDTVNAHQSFFLIFSLQQTDSDLMELGLRDIRSTACRVMREPKPYECQQLNSANSIGAMTFGIVLASIALIGLAKLF